MRLVLISGLIALLLIGGLNMWRVQFYSITPGTSTPVGPLVSVTGLKIDSHRDRILLTDVYLQPLTALQWIVAHFQPHTELVSANQLVLPGVPTSQLVAQGYLEMAISKDDARAAALKALGWTIPHTAAGAVINAVVHPSTAYRAGLRVADRIVAVNSTPVTSACDLIRAIEPLAPGTTALVRKESAHISANGIITMGPARTVKVTTTAAASGSEGVTCPGPKVSRRSVIGVGIDDAITYSFPGHIDIATPRIGGPSAGLAMTLTLIDQLSAGSLTGGRSIAATGTIDSEGRVGDVGGVAEKTVAVERAGASVFLVPAVEVKVAQSANDGTLRIVGVRTLAQALRELRRLGGAAPVSLTKPYALGHTP